MTSFNLIALSTHSPIHWSSSRTFNKYVCVPILWYYPAVLSQQVLSLSIVFCLFPSQLLIWSRSCWPELGLLHSENTWVERENVIMKGVCVRACVFSLVPRLPDLFNVCVQHCKAGNRAWDVCVCDSWFPTFCFRAQTLGVAAYLRAREMTIVYYTTTGETMVE